MQSMTTFLLRLPQSLMDEVTQLCHECHGSKSAFIRQSILMNIDLTKNVHLPAAREYFRQRIPTIHP